MCFTLGRSRLFKGRRHIWKSLSIAIHWSVNTRHTHTHTHTPDTNTHTYKQHTHYSQMLGRGLLECMQLDRHRRQINSFLWESLFISPHPHRKRNGCLKLQVTSSGLQVYSLLHKQRKNRNFCSFNSSIIHYISTLNLIATLHSGTSLIRTPMGQKKCDC